MSRKTRIAILTSLIVFVGICALGTSRFLRDGDRRTLAFLYVNSLLHGDPAFRYLYEIRDDNARYESFVYQSLDGEVKYAEDCIGCNEEVGDTSVLRTFRSAQESEDQYNRALEVGNDANYRQEVPDQSVLKNPEGRVIGKQSLSVLYEDGKIIRARLIWVENGEYWHIISIDEKHVRAFERSELFHMIKQSMPLSASRL